MVISRALNLKKSSLSYIYNDLFLLFFTWSFPLFFQDNSGLWLFNLITPVLIQLFLFSVLGHFDFRFGSRFRSERRIIIDAFFTYIITMFIYKYVSLLIFDVFSFRIRTYFSIYFPAQILVYFSSKIYFYQRLKKNKPQDIAIIGDEEDVQILKKWLNEHEVKRQDFKATFCVNYNKQELIDLKSKSIESIDQKSKIYDILKKHDLIIYFQTQILDTRQARNLLRFGSEEGSLVDFPTFCGFVRECYPVDFIDSDWLLKNSSNLWFKISFYLRLRRVFDYLGALILLVLTFPIMVLTAIIIKLTSKGPIFYFQERVGRFGHKFNIIKFRSMYLDAEVFGPKFSSADDTRITAFGRFIRKTRIDELPQVFNIFNGDMGLIGPRPEREHFEKTLMNDLPLFQLRNFVLPGITGLAQVRGNYANDIKSYKQKLGFDIYYIMNISIVLDFQILVGTIRTIIFKKGT